MAGKPASEKQATHVTRVEPVVGGFQVDCSCGKRHPATFPNRYRAVVVAYYHRMANR